MQYSVAKFRECGTKSDIDPCGPMSATGHGLKLINPDSFYIPQVVHWYAWSDSRV